MTSTAKNFADQNLRGRSFKGKDLSGSDFSGADLRGADFTDAILRGVNFSKAETGAQRRWILVQSILSFLMCAASGLMAGLNGIWIASLANGSQYLLIALLSIFFLIVTLATFTQQGFTEKAFSTLLTVSMVVICLTILLSITLASIGRADLVMATNQSVNGLTNVLLAAVSTLLATITVSVIIGTVMVGTFAAAVALDSVKSLATTTAIGICIGLGVPIYIALRGNADNAKVEIIICAVSVSIITLLSSIYVAWRTSKSDPKFELFIKLASVFAAIGGTSFRGADLTNADFTEALLKGSKFHNSRRKITNLTRTLWSQSQKLDRARVGQSILSNPEVRELLVTGKLNPSKSYEGLNLRGANLDGVYLEKVNFKHAILSEASVRKANLEWVNLTEAQAIGTDFTGAQMTGICLEGWSYDHTTKLDDVDCRFVFELEHPNAKGSRERRPHDPEKEFAEGDFTKLYSETLNVVKLLIRNGINAEAFNNGWQKAIKDNPKISFENIQEIKKRGQDVEVIVIVPEDTDKGKFEQNFDKGINAKHQAVIEAKDAEINSLRKDKSYFQDLLFLQFTQSTNINFNPTIHAEAKAVAEQNPVTIKAGRDISGNVINLGEIKGNVTNAINQIPNKENSGDIKTLLTQLQEAISADKDLADEDKADALEQVENLAKIALHDKPAEKSTLASKAIRALKRIIDNIPTISKIVETISKVFSA